MIAAENGNVDAAKALIESGADVNVRTRDGHTALSFISASDADTRSLLETYGAIEGIR
jgi:ankyrin repeat protein